MIVTNHLAYDLELDIDDYAHSIFRRYDSSLTDQTFSYTMLYLVELKLRPCNSYNNTILIGALSSRFAPKATKGGDYE